MGAISALAAKQVHGKGLPVGQQVHRVQRDPVHAHGRTLGIKTGLGEGQELVNGAIGPDHMKTGGEGLFTPKGRLNLRIDSLAILAMDGRHPSLISPGPLIGTPSIQAHHGGIPAQLMASNLPIPAADVGSKNRPTGLLRLARGLGKAC